MILLLLLFGWCTFARPHVVTLTVCMNSITTDEMTIIFSKLGLPIFCRQILFTYRKLELAH